VAQKEGGERRRRKKKEMNTEKGKNDQ